MNVLQTRLYRLVRRRASHIDIIYEDRDLLVANKPAGILTSTGPRERRPTLLAQVRDYLAATDARARVGLIHRLDKDAAGLLIFSKNNRAYHALKTQFFHHTVRRIYHAVVHGVLTVPSGTIRSHLVETTTGKVHSTKLHGKGQLAVTRYQTLRTGSRWSLLRVELETGRKHQIRVHLSEMNHPIINDPMYGPKSTRRETLMLLASELSVIHPRTDRKMTWTLPLPASFARDI